MRRACSRITVGAAWERERRCKVLKNIKFEKEVNEMSWEKSGRLFFLTTGKGEIDVFRYADLLKEAAPEAVHQLYAHTANCYCIEFDAKGEHFAVGGADAMVSIWNVRPRRRRLPLVSRGWRAGGPCLSSTGSRLGPPSHRLPFTPAQARLPTLGRAPLDRRRSLCASARLTSSSGPFARSRSRTTASTLPLVLKTCTSTVRQRWHPRPLACTVPAEVSLTALCVCLLAVADVSTGALAHSIHTNAPMNSVAFHPSRLLLAYAADDKDRSGRDEGSLRIFGFGG